MKLKGNLRKKKDGFIFYTPCGVEYDIVIEDLAITIDDEGACLKKNSIVEVDEVLGSKLEK